MQTNSFNGDEIDVEDQGGARRYDAAGTAVAVGKIRGNDEPAAFADLHAEHALIPALDDLVRELSNCLPLLSFADASYSQPVYCTTAIFPAVTASPVPALSSTDCIEVTPLAGTAAPGLPLQAAIMPAMMTRPTVCKGVMRAMAAILKDFKTAGFAVAAVYRSGDSRDP
jgi:hypothetical protein